MVDEPTLRDGQLKYGSVGILAHEKSFIGEIPMLKAKEDKYNGLIIDTESIHTIVSDFEQALSILLQEAQSNQKNLIWLDLTTKQGEHIAIATNLGFIFHNCEEHRITLIYQVKKDAYIPVPPTHTIGVGAVVINAKNELLMVRDRVHTSSSIYKLPGGMLEHAEEFSATVEREVYEETGITATLNKAVGFLNSHPFMYGKSNIYAIFQLTAQNNEIEVQDTDEIEEAIWMDVDAFFSHEEMSIFQKKIVRFALENKGMQVVNFEHDLQRLGKKHIEFYA
ncbi:MAG: NUDIX domain-containing protein [Epsilonproteobacteria bacterium]|nr:NUDIX domain-containing protein [Campylobacterota bacterium]